MEIIPRLRPKYIDSHRADNFKLSCPQIISKYFFITQVGMYLFGDDMYSMYDVEG